MTALLSNLPKIWNLENRVAGVDLGHGKFQFDFEAEEDIEEVLKNQPYHFDYWMLSLARWQPMKSRNYPSEITFWIRVVGVPGDYWGEPSFESIGDAIGKTVEVDLDFGRIKVVLDAFKELIFDTTVDFSGGEFHDGQEEWVSLEYEKLFGFCETCFSLCHKTKRCPLTMKAPVVKQAPRTEDNRGHDARARSYRGVVINGNRDPQGRDRGNKEYYGKGKGKMVEEPTQKWNKVEHKRTYSNRNHSGGEGDTSRRREPFKENQYASSQQTRERGNNEIRDRASRRTNQAAEHEEGEIQSSVLRVTNGDQGAQIPPSREFQEALRATQEDPLTVLPLALEQNVNLEAIKDSVDGSTAELVVEEDGMDLDVLTGDNEVKEGEFQVLAEEIDEEIELKETTITKVGEEKQEALKEGKEKGPGEVGKKQGTRKGPFVTGGSTKMRLVQSMLANPKKNAPKAGTRRGEDAKPVEEKSASHSNSTLPKP
ncbi:hypothetical protein HA466_0011130 [Hirschfeldia incana]|nr:hypothetical protein HA466_0011130 [Hirschfeldia incana]